MSFKNWLKIRIHMSSENFSKLNEEQQTELKEMYAKYKLCYSRDNNNLGWGL